MVTPKNSKNNPQRKLRHGSEYKDFVAWISLPKELREPKTQRALACEFGVGEDTLSEWKLRDSFWDEVAEKRRTWCKEKTTDVINALYKRIVTNGSAAEIRLWMEVIEDWSAKEARSVSPYDDIKAMTDEELTAERKKLEAFFKKKSHNKVTT